MIGAIWADLAGSMTSAVGPELAGQVGANGQLLFGRDRRGHHLWRIGFPFDARRKLRGLRLVATDVDWAASDGAEVRGPIDALLLLTGDKR